MTRCHHLIVALSTLLLASAALAESSSPAGHGERAYRDALRFAEQNQLPHFTVQGRNGVRRIVVNVTNDKMQAWCNTFSKQKCYIEPFFSATNRNGPSWSMLRMGNENWRQYGAGSPYDMRTWGGRLAFPVSLSQQELATTEQKIRNGYNSGFNYGGGDPESRSSAGRNCTNWVTYKIGQFTGVTTCSVVHHASSLMQGHASERMTVVGVMSERPIPNFGQDQLVPNWPAH